MSISADAFLDGEEDDVPSADAFLDGDQPKKKQGFPVLPMLKALGHEFGYTPGMIGMKAADKLKHQAIDAVSSTPDQIEEAGRLNPGKVPYKQIAGRMAAEAAGSMAPTTPEEIAMFYAFGQGAKIARYGLPKVFPKLNMPVGEAATAGMEWGGKQIDNLAYKIKQMRGQVRPLPGAVPEHLALPAPEPVPPPAQPGIIIPQTTELAPVRPDPLRAMIQEEIAYQQALADRAPFNRAAPEAQPFVAEGQGTTMGRRQMAEPTPARPLGEVQSAEDYLNYGEALESKAPFNRAAPEARPFVQEGQANAQARRQMAEPTPENPLAPLADAQQRLGYDAVKETKAPLNRPVEEPSYLFEKDPSAPYVPKDRPLRKLAASEKSTGDLIRELNEDYGSKGEVGPQGKRDPAAEARIRENAAELAKRTGEKAEGAAVASAAGSVAKDLPIIEGRAKTGKPHAVFAYNQQLDPSMPVEAYYDIFGDPNLIPKTTSWGSSVTASTLKELGIDVIGKAPRAAKLKPGVMNEAAEAMHQQTGFNSIEEKPLTELLSEINKDIGQRGSVGPDGKPRMDNPRLKENVAELVKRARAAGYKTSEEIVAFAARSGMKGQDLHKVSKALQGEVPDRPPTPPPAAPPPPATPTEPAPAAEPVEPRGVLSKTGKLKEQFYDRFESIKYAKGKEIDPANPNAGGNYTEAYVKARLMKGKIRGKGEELLNDLNRRVEPIKSEADRKILDEIYSLRNFADLDRAGKRTSGIDAAQAEAKLAELRQRVGAERFDRIAGGADQIAAIQNNEGLNALVEGKVITAKRAQELREQYPNYLPSEIVDEELGLGANYAKDALGRNNPGFLKRKLGTDKQIKTDVLDLTRRSLVEKVAASEKQQVIDQVAKDFGVEIGEWRKTGDRTVIEVDKGKIPPGYVQSSVRASNGKVVAVSQDVEKMLTGLNQVEQDMVSTTMGHFNHAFRLGATTYRIPFTVNNMERDIQQALLQMRPVEGQPKSYTGTYMKAMLVSLKDTLGIDDATMNAMKKAGAAYGGATTSIHKSVDLPFRMQPLGVKIGKIALAPVTLPFRAVAGLAQFSENSTRLAEFMRVNKSNLHPDLKALSVRDSTIDFEKMGSSMQLLNKWVPFLNAGVQGDANTLRMARTHPALFAGRLTAYAVAPTIALHEWNRQFDNDEFVDPYLKKNYWYINTGAEAERNGRKVPILITIRKSETAVPLAGVVDAMLERLHGDKDAIEERNAQYDPKAIASSMAAKYVPPLPRTALEEAANFDFYRNQELIGPRLKDVAPKYQFSSTTSNTARRMGEKLNISPKRIEHTMRGVFPANQQLFELSDELLKPKPEIPRRKKNALLKLEQLFPMVKTPSGNYSRPEAIAYRFENQSKQERRTPNFMAAQALRDYYDNRSEENLENAHKFLRMVPGKDKRRIIREANKEFKLLQADTEVRATKKLPKRDRKAFRIERNK